MLLQSHAGTLDILPALPHAWSTGSFRGLRARGGFTVGVTWSQGQPDCVEIRADRASVCRFRCLGIRELRARAGEYVLESGLVGQVQLAAGETITLERPSTDL